MFRAVVRSLTCPELSWFAMPLGFAGLGSAWSATDLGSLGEWASQICCAISLVVWLALTVAYLIAFARRIAPGYAHPTQGPLVSFIPAVGLLLAIHYGALAPVARVWSVVAFVVVLAVFDAFLVGHWLTGGPGEASVHPGYFAAVVAGPFIATIGLQSVHLTPVAWACFGVGIFFFLAIGGVVLDRLISSPVREGSLPSTAILMAAPATADVAWLIAHGDQPDAVSWALAGLVGLMLMVQLTLVPRYLRARFSMSFWTFSFPLASASNVAARLSAAAGSPVLARILILSVVSAIFVALLFGTALRVVGLGRELHRHRRAA